ncbi:hypothetical protein A1Q1_07974 [Trichosporon asahii var. asahii CBS 2479]|uniref:Uncharacterized protein n=1 Tax=Trichosporon asahii var. asahii (strain ATCC 90039 / CBS 2479 / JCM 2466 / KCTC 7840 / NBRC 103889/ NCYC 2677 / UAMH 7654) TaxID=1186058 RepID=J5TGW3_TRIAS|nr:hypothetical protein A1Q1_07974 [Trichosporon asahii var. asahii CBS 2479]EJT50866.1 hypothetical protein A1Q1_07974 [Trichosporon asahii var. asahii CBS 2479]
MPAYDSPPPTLLPAWEDAGAQPPPQAALESPTIMTNRDRACDTSARQAYPPQRIENLISNASTSINDMRNEIHALFEKKKERQGWNSLDEIRKLTEEREKANQALREQITELQESMALLKAKYAIYRPRGPEDYAWLREEKTPPHPFKSIVHDAVATRKGSDCSSLMQWTLEAVSCEAKPRDKEVWRKMQNKRS